MGEKKLYLYMNDAEYGRKLQRYMNANRHPFMRVEMMTEREMFWEGREHGGSTGEYWMTDDIEGAEKDRGDASSLIVLDAQTDEQRQRVSCRMKAESIYTMVLSTMALETEAKGDEMAPMRGVYGVYSPWGEEGSVLSALLSQRLAGFGKCLYINLCEFPVFYDRETTDDINLGELFFRMDSVDLSGVVMRAKKKYGNAERLPGISHFRDLWDIDETDMDRIINRLENECGFRYIVVLFNDVRGAMPMADMLSGVFFTHRKSDSTDPLKRWKGYAGTEKREGNVHTVIMPSGWERWIATMERTEPEAWLDDNEKKEFIDGIWNECESP